MIFHALLVFETAHNKWFRRSLYLECKMISKFLKRRQAISYFLDCKIANKYTCFWFFLAFHSCARGKNSCMTIRKHYKTLETCKKPDTNETFWLSFDVCLLMHLFKGLCKKCKADSTLFNNKFFYGFRLFLMHLSIMSLLKQHRINDKLQVEATREVNK